MRTEQFNGERKTGETEGVLAVIRAERLEGEREGKREKIKSFGICRLIPPYTTFSHRPNQTL